MERHEHNFKYHSLEDLQRLIDGLKANLSMFDAAAELHLSLRDLALEHMTKDAVEIDKEMLEQAETELMERMLLGKES